MTGDSQIWQEQLAHVQQILRVVRDRPPSPEDGTDILKNELRRAQIASLFPDSQRELDDAIARAAGGAQAAILTQQRWRRYEDDGQIQLVEPGLPPRLCPVGDARLDWPTWIQCLSVALIARDSDTLNALCTPESIEACSLPATAIDPFWPFYCSALAATVVEPTAAVPLITDATAGLAQSTIADPNLIALRLRPLLQLAKALSTDAEAFNAALQVVLTSHQQFYRQADPYDWSGLFALEATALTALAVDRGFAITIQSDYLPSALISGELSFNHTEVIYHFPQRSIFSADEAHWFLDLAGFPRQGRSHQLLENNGQLMACYNAHAAPGLPHAIAPFILMDAAAADTANPAPALDAGQLLALAETFASELLPDVQQAKARISDAIACVNAAISRISPSQTAISVASLTSPQGKHLYQTEPARFRRDRLIAYRDGLTAVLSKLDTPSGTPTPVNAVAPTSPVALEATVTDTPSSADILSNHSVNDSREINLRTEALVAMTVIRAQAMPLLAAIAQDKTGEVVSQLIPQDHDYAQVFVPEMVETARAGYSKLWDKALPLQRPDSTQTEIHCSLSPAGMLQDDNELSYHFPRGYRTIANYLNPHRVWLSWQYSAPGQASGLSFDGLVWLNDHWVWFPKPYRILRR